MRDNVRSNAVYPDNMMDMFPEVHKRMMPYVAEAVRLYGDGQPLTEDSLSKMSQYVVRKSFAADPPPQWHSERSLGDIARGMILAELMEPPFEGGRDDFDEDEFFPFFPAFPFFIDGRGFRGRRRFRREFERHDDGRRR